MTRLIMLALAIVSFVSCEHQTQLDENKKNVIIDEVKQTLNNNFADTRKSGLTAEFKYLDNSPDFFWVPPGYTSAISYDSVATVVKQNAAKYKLIDNSFEQLRVIPLAETIATYTGRLHSSMTDTSGKTTTVTLWETGTMIKKAGEWKLLSGQTAVMTP